MKQSHDHKKSLPAGGGYAPLPRGPADYEEEEEGRGASSFYPTPYPPYAAGSDPYRGHNPTGYTTDDYGDDDNDGEVYARPGPWADAELLPVPQPLPPPLRSHTRDQEEGGSYLPPAPLASTSSRPGAFPSTTPSSPHPRPAPRFVFKFPEALDSCLRPIDDALIRLLQVPSGPVFLGLSLALTAFTTIELAFVVPLVFFVAGWDSLASELTYLALVTALMSQIPKRFLWRSRPYVVGRAQTRRKDKTSSFPSRAVTCAVVYAFAFCFSIVERSDHPHRIEWWMPLVVLLAALLASFARINLGVHYPSDCLGGLLQGSVICVLGTLLWEADVLACGSCSAEPSGCYASGDQAITWSSLGRANWWVFAGLFTGMAVVVAICLAKPLDFWAKCDRVFGMLFPCVAFRVTFLCPVVGLNEGASLSAPSWPPAWYSYLVGAGLAAALTVVGVANKGRYPFGAYLVFFFITFFSLSWWRLFVSS